jgi:hypothetical protein
MNFLQVLKMWICRLLFSSVGRPNSKTIFINACQELEPYLSQVQYILNTCGAHTCHQERSVLDTDGNWFFLGLWDIRYRRTSSVLIMTLTGTGASTLLVLWHLTVSGIHPFEIRNAMNADYLQPFERCCSVECRRMLSAAVDACQTWRSPHFDTGIVQGRHSTRYRLVPRLYMHETRS